jgi:hypothetical protein
VNFEDRLYGTSIREAAYEGAAPARDYDLDQKFAEFNRTYAARCSGSIQRAKFELEREGIELERAAYEAACRCERDGDIGSAIGWFYKAAVCDFSDAAYRLAILLERKADNLIHIRSYGSDTDDVVRLYRYLVAETARWYAEAYSVGHIDAPERLENFLRRFQRGLRILAKRGSSPESEEWKCIVIEARAADFLTGQLAENDANSVREHLKTCRSCQRSYFRASEIQAINIRQNSIQAANRRFVKSLLPRGRVIAG